MSSARVPAKLEVGGLLRRIAADGGFSTVLRKGDPESGTLLLVVTSRGRHVACLERVLGAGGAYAWQLTGPPDSGSSVDLQAFLARRARFDPDSWVLELDIADPERFIAETTSAT